MRTKNAFTLIELMLSITILSVVLMVTASMLNVSLEQLRQAESRVGQFQEAQAAFESITRRLSSCELNPYYDYSYPGNNLDAVPTEYVLESDLHFVTGPTQAGTAPLIPGSNRPTHSIFFHGTYGLTDQTDWKGLGTLLNSWGYFIEFSDDNANRANFLNNAGGAPTRYRFRLKELQVPAESIKTYALGLSRIPSPSPNNLYQWFRSPAADPAMSRTVAENMIAMIITPLQPDTNGETNHDLAPKYFYDSRAYQFSNDAAAKKSRNRLPPLVRVTLVALDEVSAADLADANGTEMPDFGLSELFDEASNYEEDLATLEKTLIAKKLRYRVFTSTIRLRNAKWSSVN
jgi:uncharacterized protein (TIGR02599 family)